MLRGKVEIEGTKEKKIRESMRGNDRCRENRKEG